jgi:hypothetical protein
MGHGQTYKRTLIGSILGSLLVAAAVVVTVDLIERTVAAPLSASRPVKHGTNFASVHQANP